jgi:hypothetical protein
MATAEEIAFVRRNAALAADDPVWTDEVLEALIDAEGLDGSVATVWESKASTYVVSVDVTEAGASHKFSDLYKNASAQAKYWRDKLAPEEDISDRVKVRKIVRS